MRKLKLLLISFCAFFLFSGTTKAQTYSYGLNPDLDSLAIHAIWARMDSIKQTRPTVALVLSGGGAKGAAHVGVLKYLEEIEMPIDIILGTSMGGLVGGLYSVGHSAAQIDSMIRTLDWSMQLSDKVPISYLSYPDRMYKRKYLLSIPFYYNAEEFASEHLRLGVEGNENDNSLTKDNILSSLPSGFVYGQNVNNLFSSLTVGYQSDMPFWKLPIPFVCVATEMVTSQAKVWYSGKLNTALRSTMSIPGLFTPVRTDGMVLLDGGMRNNYPTDIANYLHADFVIGVDLSEGYMDYDDLKNLSDIALQGIDMFGRASYENNTSKTDVTIKPDITGYNMLSFDSVSIDSLITRGERAAVEQAANLLAMKEMVGPDILVLQDEPADNLKAAKVLVDGVEILGVNDEESLYLMERLKIKAGQSMGSEDIEDAVATIYATKAFDYVNYELVGDNQPYRLKFNCKKGPIHQLGVGARLDTDEMVSLLFNLGLNVHSVKGHSFDFTAKVGTNPYGRIHYYYKTTAGPTVNVATSLKYVERNRFSFGENLFNVTYLNQRNDFFLSNIKWKEIDLNLGFREEFYRLGTMMAQTSIDDTNLSSFKKNHYLSAYLSGHADTFDNGYFPTRGFSLALDYSWVFGGLVEKIEAFHVAQFDFKTVANFGPVVSILPFARARFLFGDEIPTPFVNVVGGCMAGRYLDQQMPFIGVTNAAALSRLLAVAGFELRGRLFKNNYLSWITNVGDSSDTFKGLSDIDSMFIGTGFQYSYNSIVGPIKADIHWSTLTRSLGCYIGIGFDF